MDGDDYPFIKKNRKSIFGSYNFTELEPESVFHERNVRTDLYHYIKHDLPNGQYAILDPVFNEYGLVGYASIVSSPLSSEFQDMNISQIVWAIAQYNKLKEIENVQDQTIN